MSKPKFKSVTVRKTSLGDFVVEAAHFGWPDSQSFHKTIEEATKAVNKILKAYAK